MSISKETKIRILENFYAIDYILFGKPFKSIKLNEGDCSVCNDIMVEEYISSKGALLQTVIELYRLIDHKPEKINEIVDKNILNKMACESAKIARNNAIVLLRTDKAKNSIRSNVINSLTENDLNINEKVNNKIHEKAYSLAIDNLLISRAINESNNYSSMNDYIGLIIEDAYLILRDSVIESAMEIKNSLIENQVKIGPVKKGELELPEGKDVEETSEKHFKDLIKKDGWVKVSKRIIALKVWNKNRNPSLSKKMDELQAKLAKWVDNKRDENPDFGQ